MKVFKKAIFLFMIVSYTIFAVSCSSSVDNDSNQNVSGQASTNNESNQNISDQASTNNESDKQDNKTSEKEELIKVEEQVILDQDGIVITLKSLSQDNVFGPSLKVLIENNTEKSITVQIIDSSVNDVMVDPMFSCDVAPNKKSNDEIIFLTSDLDAANISTIKDFEFKFHIFDSQSWDGIFDSENINIVTNANDSYIQEYDDSGVTVLDEEGIRIIIKRVDSQDSLWGADIYTYIENNSNTDIIVNANDVSINGYMIEPMFSSEVLSGKKVYTTLTFFESDLEANDIENMELSFSINKKDTWETIIDSPKTTVSFE